jgi:hypothetical protein
VSSTATCCLPCCAQPWAPTLLLSRCRPLPATAVLPAAGCCAVRACCCAAVAAVLHALLRGRVRMACAAACAQSAAGPPLQLELKLMPHHLPARPMPEQRWRAPPLLSAFCWPPHCRPALPCPGRPPACLPACLQAVYLEATVLKALGWRLGPFFNFGPEDGPY